MGTVIEESQGASTAGSVVDHLGHHGTIVLEEEFVADTDLTGWLHEHIPQTQVGVQLAQQEHLDLGISLLLGAIETGGEHLGVVEDKGIVLVEIVEDVTEVEVNGIALFVEEIFAVLVFLRHLDTSALTVEHHEAALIAVVGRFQCNLLFGQFKLKLR